MINGIMFQYFEFNLPADGTLWKRLETEAGKLAGKGVTAVWLPPAYKGTSVMDTGYGCYDLYDLGEFDQKGTVRTKYGTKEELTEAVRACHACGIDVYADVVLNHKAGADGTELFAAVEVNPQNRLEEIGEPHDIKGWTFFDFPGRGDRYSDFKWHFYHFTGVDYDELEGATGVFRICGDGKNWAHKVSGEFGNFDYLMFADIDHRQPDVRRELLRWAEWFANELDLDGFRLDAAKHIDAGFMRDLAFFIRAARGEDFYLVAEYWESRKDEPTDYIRDTSSALNLFDVPLHYHMMQAGQEGAAYDLRRIFDDTVVTLYPVQAVTFVENHDTQPGQSLQSPVADWFKPLAYALILLREQGYPCVFYGDYYGTQGPFPLTSFREIIDKLLLLRRHYAFGEQEDYFEAFEAIGWVRKEDHWRAPLAVIITTQDEPQTIRMNVGTESAGKIYADFLGNLDDKVTIAEDGSGLFPVAPRSVSCWLPDGLPLEDIPVP